MNLGWLPPGLMMLIRIDLAGFFRYLICLSAVVLLSSVMIFCWQFVQLSPYIDNCLVQCHRPHQLVQLACQSVDVRVVFLGDS